MRLFVAIEIPEDVRDAIAQLIKSLRGTCRDARWVRASSLHLTLKFIGEAPPAAVDDLKAALKSIPPRLPIPLTFSGLGFFPNEGRPRVLWAGVQASPALGALAAAVESALSATGITQDGQEELRDFTPHLTLARFKDSPSEDALHAAIAAAGPLNFGSTTATEFHLYQSILKPGGSEYTRLATFSLSGSTPE